MTIDISNNRVVFRNADGAATFDSDEKNMVLPNYIAATFRPRAVDSFNSGPRVFDETIVLGPCHPLARFVTGFYSVDNLYVGAIGGDCFVHVANEYVQTNAYTVSPTGVWRFTTAVWFRLQCAGGQLKARVFYRFPQGGEAPFGGVTVRVWAFCGTFDH